MSRLQKCLVCCLVCLVFFSSCAEETELCITTEEARDYYISYLEMLKTDPKKAIEDFLHFEDQDRKELSIKSANTLIEYEIVRFEMISDSLWQAELFAKSENIPDGRYGMNYVAVIEDSIRVMTSVNQIPAELLDGVELENYEVHGPGIVGEEDIIK